MTRVADYMMANEVLSAGSSKHSPSGRLRLTYGADGTLGLYDTARGMRLLWNVAGTFPGGRLVMQHDGNLVLYASGGRAVWSSGTFGNTGAFLRLQDDGNMVIYRNGKALWSSRTYQFRPGSVLAATAGLAATMHGDIEVDRPGRVYGGHPHGPHSPPYDPRTYKQDLGFGADIEVDRPGRVYQDSHPHGGHALPYDSRTYRQDLGFGFEQIGGTREAIRRGREHDEYEDRCDESDEVDELGEGKGS